MADYQRQTFKFANAGVQCRPVNAIDPAKYPYLKNVTTVIDGTLQTRYGYTTYANSGVASAIHTLRRVNNISDANVRYGRLIGVGDRLLLGKENAAPVQIAAGFSGNPLSLVPYRPLQSPETWVYVADANQMRKFNLDGTVQQMGIYPPVSAPEPELAQPLYIYIEDFYETAGWTAGGIAGGIALGQRVPSGTTIDTILYDSGNFGWACVSFNIPGGDTSWLGVGARLDFAGGTSEAATIEEVFSVMNDAQVGSIVYDNGTAGPCTVQLSTPFIGLMRNQLLKIGSEYVRVLSVAEGPDGLYSFRCSTTSTHAAGETISSPISTRIWFAFTHAAGDPVSSTTIQFTCTVTSSSGQEGYISKASNIDISHIADRPINSDDYIHISVRVDNPMNFIEGRVYFDIDATHNDFEHNARYLSFRPSDFVSTATGTLSTVVSRQTAVQRQQIDTTQVPWPYRTIEEAKAANAYFQNPAQGTDPITAQFNSPVSAQSNTGTQAWTELFLPISSLATIGSDLTRTLASIKAIRIYFLCTATMKAEIDSWWAGGGYGPNVVPTTNGIGYQGQPYLYRVRYRSSKTGAVSAPSPSHYSGVLPRRGRVIITPPVSSDPQVDKIDIERFGGTLSDGFHYVGTCANQPDITFDDDLDDDAIITNEAFPEDTYMPFPVDDLPRTGTVDCVGTVVIWKSGDKFNTNWAPGTQIIIDQIAYTLNGPPLSDQRLWTVENVGTKTGAAFYIPNPTIMGAPLPAMWGPLHNRNFGCGHPDNPGIVYFTNPDDPDSASDKGWVEVTSPSEPLMNGCVYQGSSIVFSTESPYRLEPSYTDSPNSYTPIRLASGRGLYARYGLCSGPKIWFVGRDGIYEYAADGGAISITNDDLYSLFPHDSQPGESFVVGDKTIIAPDYNQPNFLRLNYCNNWLYFDYLGLDGNFHTLAFDTLNRRWQPYEYTPGASLHVTEEGQSINSTLIGFGNGTVGFMGGYLDGGAAIDCIVKTPANDLGDTRATKQFGDLTLDAQGGGSTINLTIAYDNYTVTQAPSPTTDGNAARSYLTYDIDGGEGALYRNIALELEWQSNSVSPTVLYEWQPSWLVKPEFTTLRATDYDDAGYGGNKWVQGVRITCDTGGVPRQVKVVKDGGVDTGIIITVNANGETTLPFSWTPFEAHRMRLQPVDTTGQWRIMNVEWIYEPAPELASIWQTQWTSHDLEGWQHIRDLYIQYRASAAATIVIKTDAGMSYTVNLPATDTTRYYTPIGPIKGKAFQYIINGPADLQIYKLDLEVRVKPWGSSGSYVSAKPFGDMSRSIGGGARI